MRSGLFMLPLVLLCSTAAFATTAPLTPGNIVVAVSGKGASGITFTDNQASPLSLYQYTPTGNNHATFAGSSVVTGSVNPISSEYGSSSEGMLQRSGDGKSLTIMGYGISASTFNASPSTYVPQTSTNAGKLNALAQSTSMAGGTTVNGTTYQPVARVIADITADGNVDTSTALLNVFDQNNPRSVYTQNGTSYYVSGQGVSGDATGGVFYATEGASSATPITGLDTSNKTAGQDTRDVQVYNGQLYVSVDSKQGSNAARSFVGTLGTGTPTTAANNGDGPTMLLGYADGKGKMTMTAATGNGLNTGKQINLSPEQFFFADPNTLYVSDAGVSKQTSASSTLGDGGLQKWTQTNGVWSLAYTLSAGLGLVTNTSASGTIGLFGLAGQNNGDGTVSLYATSYTIGDTDPSYLFAITDTLSATTGAGESFTTIDSLTGSKFMGVAFAPDAAASVPEPASWAMMVAGFGLLGGLLRRERTALRA
ncbi:hypothetical protein FHS31_000973 [Sphingomonas vulcanisoli]|uniref:Ice-binding protein C-terminal domain-containing protein n=1 Tax=Sphingomonas vulcanisoli TaxID=1658060 RepID=A0ABX0TSL3_9SPHN|nr:PEPxxWA-CTERM sorting domain-containing protein [Sphingomonas vulcanisoli]NIJ07377.1 hypothetical protein [Sphingomonas vulcanisoli]